MASRLLSRYARLVCRASCQAPATAAARSLQPVASHAELQRAQGWPWVTERLMSERKALAKDDIVQTTNAVTRLDELLEKAATPEDVLQAWTEHGKNVRQATMALRKWTLLVQRMNGSFQDLMVDSRLQDMIDTIFREVSSMPNSNLVSALRSFWIMDVPPTHLVLRSVQTEVLWRVRKLSYNQLAQLLDWGQGRDGQQDVAIVNTALKQMELRWTEITDAKTVPALIAKGHYLSPALVDRLGDKALELAEGFSAEDSRRICLSLAAQNRRSVPLLRALSYHLLQKPSFEFTNPVIMDIAFAYGKLNFNHSQVFQRMASELLPRVTELSSGDVTRFAKSMGYLKWLHIPLFEAFAEHYIVNSESYSIAQLCNLLLTCARLNFLPSRGEKFFSKVHSALEKSLSGLNPNLQADVLWSLCVLQQAKPHYLIPFIQQNVTNLSEEDKAAQTDSHRLKLLQIAATLHLEYPDSSDSDTSSFLTASSAVSSVSPMQSGVRETLQSMMGGRTEALRTGVKTVYGWTIDGELVVDCDNKPIDMSMLKAPHLPSGGGDQALPEGAQRVAFLAWEFPNFGSKSRDLLGRWVLMKRHLQLAGFITVEVPYYEWLGLKTEWKKVAYLKDKMWKALAEDKAK